MAKSSGLGQNLYFCGPLTAVAVDLSGDIGSIDKASGGPKLLDITGLNSSAVEKAGGVRNGEIDYTAYWNTAAGQEHAAFSALPAGDTITLWLFSGTAGDPAAAIQGVLPDYAPKRGQDGSLTSKLMAQCDNYGLHWGKILLPKTTDGSATTHTAVDWGTASTLPAALTISANTQANPSVVTTTVAHGLATGDSVNITGSNSNPVINGDYTVTVLSATTFSVPVNVTTGAGTAGTVQQTSTDFGAVAYIVLFAFAGTSMTPALQDSPDNTTFATLANMSPAAMTAALGGQRIVGQNTDIIRRYVRANSTGTFTNAVWAAVFHRAYAKSW